MYKYMYIYVNFTQLHNIRWSNNWHWAGGLCLWWISGILCGVGVVAIQDSILSVVHKGLQHILSISHGRHECQSRSCTVAHMNHYVQQRLNLIHWLKIPTLPFWIKYSTQQSAFDGCPQNLLQGSFQHHLGHPPILTKTLKEISPYTIVI